MFQKYFILISLVFLLIGNSLNFSYGETPTSSFSTFKNPHQAPQAFSSTIPKWESDPASTKSCTGNQDVLLAPDPDLSVLLAMRRKHAELSAWATELDHKQVMITAASHSLSVQLAALKRFQDHLNLLQTQQSETTKARQQALAQTYEVMHPRDAAQIFQHLDQNLVVGILQRMDSRHVAAILAAMTPSEARSATEGLAGMKSVLQ